MIKHYYALQNPYGELISCDAWEYARKHNEHFAIGDSKEEWLSKCGNSGNDGNDDFTRERAKIVAGYLKTKGVKKVHSVGVGNAYFEYYLKGEYPKLDLTISDFTDSVLKLKEYFPECNEVQKLDLRKDRVMGLGDSDSCLLMYRIDTAFTDSQWDYLFQKLNADKVQNVLFMPARILDLKYYLSEKLKCILYWLRGEQKVLAGYLRTKSAFKDFWIRYYHCEERNFEGMTGFWLGRR